MVSRRFKGKGEPMQDSIQTKVSVADEAGSLKGRLPRLFRICWLVVASLILLQVDGETAVHMTTKAGMEAQQQRSPLKKKARIHVQPQQSNPYLKEIKKEKSIVLVSRKLADLVRNDNRIVLSETAIKQRLDKDGGIAGYELVQIDRPGVLDKIGLRQGDIITSVNGIPAPEFTANPQVLGSASRFDLGIKRKERTKHLIIEIR